MLYSDSMAAPLPYLNTILDAARESGRSEREISRTATGQPAALSLIKTGRVPSVERVRLLCAALDLEFYIGPARETFVSAPRPEARPPSGNEEPAADDRRPPWFEALRTGLREDVANLLKEVPGRRPDDGSREESASPREAPAARHAEIRHVAADADRHDGAREDEAASHVAFRRDWVDRHGIDPGRCAVLGVQGESMEPTVPDGSLVLIDCTRRSLRNGRVFVVRTGDGLSVKRIGKDADGGWLLVNDHPGWSDARWPDNAEVIGEVRWVATLLA